MPGPWDWVTNPTGTAQGMLDMVNPGGFSGQTPPWFSQDYANNPWENPNAPAWGGNNQQAQQQNAPPAFPGANQMYGSYPQDTSFNLNQHLQNAGYYAQPFQQQLFAAQLAPALNMNAYTAGAMAPAYAAAITNNRYANPAYQQARGQVATEQVRQGGMSDRLAEALPMLMGILGQFGGLGGGTPQISTNYGAGARFSGGQ